MKATRHTPYPPYSPLPPHSSAEEFDPPRALRFFEAAHALAPRPALLLSCANMLLKLGQGGLAAELYRTLLGAGVTTRTDRRGVAVTAWGREGWLVRVGRSVRRRVVVTLWLLVVGALWRVDFEQLITVYDVLLIR